MQGKHFEVLKKGNKKLLFINFVLLEMMGLNSELHTFMKAQHNFAINYIIHQFI